MLVMVQAPQDSRPLPYTTEAESAEALLALLRGPVTQGSSSSSSGGGDPLGQQPSTSFGRSSHSSQRSVPSRHYRSASVSPELTDDAASPSSSSRIMNPPPSNKQRRGGGKPTSIKPTTCKPTAAKLSPKPSSFQAAAQASGKRSSGKPRGGKRAKVRKPSSFVSHLYEMMLDPTLSHLCGFSSDGNSFYVTHSPEFPQTVLPQVERACLRMCLEICSSDTVVIYGYSFILSFFSFLFCCLCAHSLILFTS